MGEVIIYGVRGLKIWSEGYEITPPYYGEGHKIARAFEPEGDEIHFPIIQFLFQRTPIKYHNAYCAIHFDYSAGCVSLVACGW